MPIPKMDDDKISALKKEVLVELVKLAQKRRMVGSKGTWKEFLGSYDKKFGASQSDPARRSTDALVAFIKTFSQKDDFEFFDKVMQRHSNLEAVKKSFNESPEQKLVCLTHQHPLYPLDYSFPSHEEDWLVTKCSKKSKASRSNSMVAVDCEMVLCEDGTEALVRICVVDHNLQVKLNELVNPNIAVVDFRTEITGVASKDLDGVTCSLTDIQNGMKKLLKHGTILVGHSLNNDLRALKLDHAKVIDTSYIFKYWNERDCRRPSLNNLCKSVLGYELRKNGAPHNCLDDACAAMKLVLAKVERGVNDITPVVCEEVPRQELSKLLLHRIPIHVPSEELHKVIPGTFTIELKTNKKTRGEKYSAFAIFKNQLEADQAFECVEGDIEKDSSGLPQKSISFQLGSGTAGSLCVRKMAYDGPANHLASNRRPLQEVETAVESKRLKTDSKHGEYEQTEVVSNKCDGHLREIQRLKQELSQRDQEIANLNKIIVALTRKQGL